MRIESQAGVAGVTDPREGKPATAAAAPGTAHQPDPASIVTISAAGSSASSAADGEILPANAARLASIRAAINAGQYPIDLDKLASRIVDDELVRGTSS